ncbi:MAG: UDP-N-acetylmuramoyl-L-alanyl-D-glutamate--2,6-diaminopimelate ligase [Acidobacteriaceae bacterium]
MRFKDLLPLNARILSAGPNPEITSVAHDSRKVDPGGLFLAIKGETTDGNKFIEASIERGAVAVVSDSADAGNLNKGAIALAVVPQGRRAMAEVAAKFFGHPERKLALNGVTGTNGKTTTTFLLDSLLNSARRRTALIGTIEYQIAGEVLASPHTTPESLDLLRILSQAVSAGVREVTMEVSSHGLDQGRVWGLHFDTAIFTNLTRDHLDYHKSMESYFAAKQLLFEGTGASAPRVAVVNADDEYGRKLMYSRSVAEVRSYGMEEGDWRAEDTKFGAEDTSFRWKTPFGAVALRFPLIGGINLYNLLAAATAAHARGLSLDQIAAGVEQVRAAPGRFERVYCGQPFTVVVDYAHTDDALRNVLRIARELAGKCRVITVFGCGGDRDRGKRCRMGRAAGEASDFVVVTSDNPRSEDPLSIIGEILPGLRATDVEIQVEADRREAIELAIREASAGDVVVIAGKGHEKTQTTRQGVFPFDDAKEAKSALHHRNAQHTNKGEGKIL